MNSTTKILNTLILAAVAASASAEDQNVCKGDPNHWRQIFNGKDLNGWKHVGPGSMTVENGLIRTHGGMGLLYWEGSKLDNCVIRVVYRMEHPNDNSGVFIRIPIEPREEWMPVHYGYEAQIDNQPDKSNEDDTHITGTLYSLTKPLAKPVTLEYVRWAIERGLDVDEFEGNHQWHGVKAWDWLARCSPCGNGSQPGNNFRPCNRASNACLPRIKPGSNDCSGRAGRRFIFTSCMPN